MRYVVGIVCVCALSAFGLAGCGETTGTGGNGGSAGDGGTAGDGGGGGTAGDGGSGGTAGDGGSAGTAGDGGSGGRAGDGGSGGGGIGGDGGSAGNGGTGGGLSVRITITDLPSTDNDGNYTLTWSSTITSSAWNVQEDDNINFPSPTGYISHDTSRPYTYDFTGKGEGYYCYRVGLSPTGPFSPPECITVTRPSVPSVPVITSSNFLNLNTVELRWNDSDTETLYELEYSFDNVSYTPLTTMPANQTSWEVNLLPPCTTTYFRLRAKNAQGYSGYYGSGPVTTDLAAIIDITTPSFNSPFIPGRYGITCWSSGTEQGAIGIYDDEHNGVVDSSHLYDFASGNNSWVFPRINVLDCPSCTTWQLGAGRAYQGAATLVLYFKFNTWSTNDHENYIAIHLNASSSSASVVNMWGGDMKAWGIFAGVALHNQVPPAPSVNGTYSLPTASEEGWFMGNGSGYIQTGANLGVAGNNKLG